MIATIKDKKFYLLWLASVLGAIAWAQTGMDYYRFCIQW